MAGLFSAIATALSKQEDAAVDDIKHAAWTSPALWVPAAVIGLLALHLIPDSLTNAVVTLGVTYMVCHTAQVLGMGFFNSRIRIAPDTSSSSTTTVTQQATGN